MIKFDPALLSFDIVHLKSVTTAMGGSISCVKDAKSDFKKESIYRIPVPLAVARSFIQSTHKITKYLKPTLVAVMKYDGFVVALERHPLSSMGELYSEGLFGTVRWVPDCQANIENIIAPTIASSMKQWYFDGRYVYSFLQQDLNTVARSGEYLTRDGSFRKVIAHSIDMQNVSNKDKLMSSERSCLAFVTSNGSGVISPPIWKNLSDVGVTQLKKASQLDDDDEDEDAGDDEEGSDNKATAYGFDRIDETLSVNLNFALKAGHDIGRTFGYEFVEPLNLPQLMVELCTVNLPNIPASIKATYGIGLKFTHTISWLLGMTRNADTLENYIVVRSLMKHLTKRGVFRNNVFDADRVFKQDHTVANVPLKSLSDLMANQDMTKISISQIMLNARVGSTIRSHSDGGVHSIDTLLNDD
jgi:hypothetical protein